MDITQPINKWQLSRNANKYFLQIILYGGDRMAVMEKTFNQNPTVLLNIVNDIAEMRKASVRRMDRERVLVDTDMYRIKTAYVFRIVPVEAGTSVTVETDGEDDNAARNVQLMFTTIENMLTPFEKVNRP